MDEGSAILHHLERRANRWLSSMVTGDSHCESERKSRDDNIPNNGSCQSQQGTLFLCGLESYIVNEINSKLGHLLKDLGFESIAVEEPLVISKDDDNGDECGKYFSDSKYVLVLCSIQIFHCLPDLVRLLSYYRLAKRRKCDVLFIVICDDDQDAVAGMDRLSSHIRAHPELSILYCTNRIHTIPSAHHKLQPDELAPVLKQWLTGSFSEDSLENLEYRDIFKMMAREINMAVPGFQVFLRLSLMTFFGIVAVIATIIILAVVSKEVGMSMDVRKARHQLASFLESHRIDWGIPNTNQGWEWRDGPGSIIALQLNVPSWCVDRDNRRRVDSLDINLLAELGRSPGTHNIAPATLAAYLNALLSVYRNPRDFYGHDLVGILEANMNNLYSYEQFDNFVTGYYVISIFNSGIRPDPKFVPRILKRQNADGSFQLGIDETSISVQALMCFDNCKPAKQAINASVNFLLSQRHPDGSYGSVYSTALVLQTFNLTRTGLGADEYDTSISWLLQQCGSDPVRRNPHIASNLLMALVGKTLLSIRSLTGYSVRQDHSGITVKLKPRLKSYATLKKFTVPDDGVSDDEDDDDDEEEEEEKERCYCTSEHYAFQSSEDSKPLSISRELNAGHDDDHDKSHDDDDDPMDDAENYPKINPGGDYDGHADDVDGSGHANSDQTVPTETMPEKRKIWKAMRNGIQRLLRNVNADVGIDNRNVELPRKDVCFIYEQFPFLKFARRTI